MPDAVYSSCKIFHFAGKLADMRAGRLSPPLHVRLKPTNRCNHRCAYCCYRNPDLPLGQQMNEADQLTREDLARIVGDICRMGVRAVTFSGGGEPLCHPQTPEAAEALAAGGVKIALLTNGSLLTGPAADVFARRATWVRVSMDAAEPVEYSRCRHVGPGEFDRVCRNIADFAQRPDRRAVIGINFIVTRENSATVAEFLALAKRIGASHVKCSAAIVGTHPADIARYIAPFFESAKAQIAQASARLADETFSVIDKLHWPDSGQEDYRRTNHRCPFAQCLTVIGADGNVYTCQDKAYAPSGLIGSASQAGFAELWASEQARRRLAELDPSRDCRHHCVAHAKNMMLLDYLQADAEHLEFV